MDRLAVAIRLIYSQGGGVLQVGNTYY